MKIKKGNKEKFAEAMVNLGQAFRNESENCAKLCGVATEKELIVIMHVGQNQNVKMSDIADNTAAPMSTLTNVVDKLVERKLIDRDHSEEDRRVINVSLTAAGKSAYNKVVVIKKKIAETVLSKLNDKEQDQAIKSLNDLAQAIRMLK